MASDAKALSTIETTPEERVLLDRLLAGEDAAYEELVRTMGGRLLAVARRITRTEQDAEDAVQDAFLSAFRALPDFDGRSSLSTWLHRIVVNAAILKTRRASGRHEVAIDDLLPAFDATGDFANRQKSWGDVTDDYESRIQQREALTRALAALPDEFRTVLLLRDIYGLDSRSVSASLGISDALVRQRLHRARQALTRLLEPTMTEPSTP